MADLKLFTITDQIATEVRSQTVTLERNLQLLIEDNMETIFGVRFLGSEYSTGPVHRGRIDSLGLDENGSPVIFEYKRTTSENVINQGLFYLDWLFDHRAEFQLLVSRELGVSVSESIDWSAPRLICVANDFTRYDEYAVRQIDRNIELVRYRDFGGQMLAVELITQVSSRAAVSVSRQPSRRVQTSGGAVQDHDGLGASPEPTEGTSSDDLPARRGTSVTTHLSRASETLSQLFEKFDTFAQALGDDVVKNVRHNYFAYRRLKNFACVEVHPVSGTLLIYVKLDPATVRLEEGFSRDVTHIGHLGTGDLELRLEDDSRWGAVEELVRRAFEAN